MSELNPTGIIPTEFKVLIRVDKVDDKSEGGLFLPEQAREREQYAHDRGVLVEVSEGAFRELPGPTPQVGDKVIFNKYAGSIIKFRDGREIVDYRLCNDKDICAIWRKE